MKPIDVELKDERGLVGTHVVFGKDQPEYFPLPALLFNDGNIVTHWELSAEDLQKIVCGGKIQLTIMTYGRPLQPIRLEVIE